ncbi:hypothetical protein [Pseudomonas syringae group genomosp. 3]|jgi:hypothetical protein|uniref:hypothetical protein n=1 Tax=Pseudomonas syringae group genomosp. 3 TaxID=251701 RepID=UPI000EFF3DBD|nr:hypothetical protein [Pseudomonas syringae group genomosp. 3]
MSRNTKDTVYCNIQMPMAQGQEFLRLISELRASGTHPALESVFKEIQSELGSSIEFVEEMLQGSDGVGRR